MVVLKVTAKEVQALITSNESYGPEELPPSAEL